MMLIFLYACWHLDGIFEEISIQGLCPFLNWVICFFVQLLVVCYSGITHLYILHTSPLLEIFPPII